MWSGVFPVDVAFAGKLMKSYKSYLSKANIHTLEGFSSFRKNEAITSIFIKAMQ